MNYHVLLNDNYVSESLTSYFFHPAKFADRVKAHELTKH